MKTGVIGLGAMGAQHGEKSCQGRLSGNCL